MNKPHKCGCKFNCDQHRGAHSRHGARHFDALPYVVCVIIIIAAVIIDGYIQ